MPQTNFEKIVDFHAALESTPAIPTIPHPDTLTLRRTLIQEEYREVMEAFAALNGEISTAVELAPLAHELADLLYVIYGTFATLGINADAVYAEVHRANMEKLGGPRRADGKLLKPAGWQPANVPGVLQQLQAQEKLT
jgi:predicted HAD superfamily Cof-like phosphohydrolase